MLTGIKGGRNERQIACCGNRLCAVDVHRSPNGGYWGLCHATGRDSRCPGRRAASRGPILGQYSRLGLPQHKSNQLPRHHDSRCYLVDAWRLLGARTQFFSVTPVIETSVSHTSHEASVFNPALFGQLAWDLGNGFGFSYALGAYFDVPETGAFSSSSLNQRFALSYTADGWNLTANAIYGIQFDSVASRPQISPCPGLFDFEGCNPDFFNIDLTATKKIGKWEVGAVAYGSTDLSRPIARKARAPSAGWSVTTLVPSLYKFTPPRRSSSVIMGAAIRAAGCE